MIFTTAKIESRDPNPQNVGPKIAHFSTHPNIYAQIKSHQLISLILNWQIVNKFWNNYTYNKKQQGFDKDQKNKTFWIQINFCFPLN